MTIMPKVLWLITFVGLPITSSSRPARAKILSSTASKVNTVESQNCSTCSVGSKSWDGMALLAFLHICFQALIFSNVLPWWVYVLLWMVALLPIIADRVAKQEGEKSSVTWKFLLETKQKLSLIWWCRLGDIIYLTAATSLCHQWGFVPMLGIPKGKTTAVSGCHSSLPQTVRE